MLLPDFKQWCLSAVTTTTSVTFLHDPIIVVLLMLGHSHVFMLYDICLRYYLICFSLLTICCFSFHIINMCKFVNIFTTEKYMFIIFYFNVDEI